MDYRFNSPSLDLSGADQQYNLQVERLDVVVVQLSRRVPVVRGGPLSAQSRAQVEHWSLTIQRGVG